MCGLATDFCVAWTALDARAAGFETTLIEDASRAIDLNGSLAQRLEGPGRRRRPAKGVRNLFPVKVPGTFFRSSRVRE